MQCGSFPAFIVMTTIITSGLCWTMGTVLDMALKKTVLTCSRKGDTSCGKWEIKSSFLWEIPLKPTVGLLRNVSACVNCADAHGHNYYNHFMSSINTVEFPFWAQYQLTLYRELEVVIDERSVGH